ncbi:MAG: hypothetical protein ABIS06_21960, partial [Vicinamibacterales bacterium]
QGSAILAAFAFAFSPFHLAQAAYHPHIAQTQWLPVYLLALWRCLDDARPASVGVLAVSVTAVVLSNFYGGLIAAVITPVAITAYWYFTSSREPGSSRHLAFTAGSLACLAAAGVIYAWWAAFPVISNSAAFAFPRADIVRYSARWWSYLVPPVASPLFGRSVDRVWQLAGVREGLLEQQVSLGWGIIGLAAVTLAVSRRRASAIGPVRAVPVLACVALFAFLFSLAPNRILGATVSPAAILYGALPMFRSFARFGMVVQLMAALLAGIGAEILWRSGRWRARAACVALVLLSVAEYAVLPEAMWRDVLPTSAHRWVARQGRSLRALDCAVLTSESASIQWLTADRIQLPPSGFDDCTQPNISDKLAASGFTHLIVRPHTDDGRWFGRHGPAEGLERVATFRDGEVFRVTRPSPLVYTARMNGFYPREHDEAWGWRWMGADASWTVVNRAQGLIVASVNLELTAFGRSRRLRLLLDGVLLQTLDVPEQRSTWQLGPLTLLPGEHELVFHPETAPDAAEALIHNGDTRRLSFALGTWQWRLNGNQR